MHAIGVLVISTMGPHFAFWLLHYIQEIRSELPLVQALTYESGLLVALSSNKTTSSALASLSNCTGAFGRLPCQSTCHVQSPLQVLGDNTDVLVSKLVERFRPGITTATDGLSTNATQRIMDKLKDLLDGRDPETGAQVAQPVQEQVINYL